MLDAIKKECWMDIIKNGFEWEKRDIIIQLLELNIEMYERVLQILEDVYYITDYGTAKICIDGIRTIRNIYMDKDFYQREEKIKIEYDKDTSMIILWIVNKEKEDQFILHNNINIIFDTAKFDFYCKEVALAIYESRNNTIH